MYTLKVIFVGLVAFVPQYRDDATLDKVWALLVDVDYQLDVQGLPKDPKNEFPPCIDNYKAKIPSKCMDFEDCVNCRDQDEYLLAEYPQHYAVVAIPARNVVGAAFTLRAADKILLPIAGNDISLVTEFSNASVMLHGGRAGANKKPSTAEEAKDFSWVASIPKFMPSRGRVDSNCLVDDPRKIKPESCAVASRFHIEEGILQTFSVGLSTLGKPQIYTFKHKKNAKNKFTTTYQQALAEEVALVVPNLTKPVKLVLTSFRDLDPQILELGPILGQSEVVVYVHNQIPHTLLDSHIYHVDALWNFQWFYKLSSDRKNCNDAFPIPAEVDTSAGRPRCPLVVFDPPPAE